MLLIICQNTAMEGLPEAVGNTIRAWAVLGMELDRASNSSLVNGPEYMSEGARRHKYVAETSSSKEA